MRKLFALLGVLTLVAMVALPVGAARQGRDSERERNSEHDGEEDRNHDAGEGDPVAAAGRPVVTARAATR